MKMVRCDEMLAQHYKSGMTLRAIAEFAGLSVTTIRVRLLAAGVKLRLRGTGSCEYKYGKPNADRRRDLFLVQGDGCPVHTKVSPQLPQLRGARYPGV